MGTVTTLPRGRAFIRDDLDTMPDDGRRYELVDGALIVTPAPSRAHQRVSAALYDALRRAAPSDLLVLFAPVDVVLSDDSVLQPDLLVVREAEFRDESLPVRPLLAVEILSPSTRHIDVGLKRARYEAAGCPSYWVFDAADPALMVWELVEGRYVERARVAGTDSHTVTAPYPIAIAPADLA
jgi:Uma2 family endonuclease